MNKLINDDLLWITNRLPSAVKQVLKDNPTQVCLAGGFIRSCVAKETVNDIDLFVPSILLAEVIVKALTHEKPGVRVFRTDNAITIIGHKHPIQIITRWTFATPALVVPSFDFTIAKAAIWYDNGHWHSLIDERFYPDLAAKRLVYTSPQREEEAGGSLLRLLKFYQRGYTATLPSIGDVIARITSGVDYGLIGGTTKQVEEQAGKVITGLLRKVDPNVDPDRIESHQSPEELPDEVPVDNAGRPINF